MSRSVLVVGAGASSEVGLPTGYALKERIAKLLDIKFRDFNVQFSGDPKVADALREIARSEGLRSINDPYLAACWRIRDAMPQAISIDNFVDAHVHDKSIEVCGKLAITRAILEAERASKSYVDHRTHPPRLDFEGSADAWQNGFFQLISENCRIGDLPERLSRISLIVFNYDRAIEHFLYYSIQNYYGVPAHVSAEILQRLEIFHPYGTVGALPWQRNASAVEYGSEIRTSDLIRLSRGIRTFAEGTDPELSNIAALRAAISRADRLVFLGFAFHPQNMSLLRADEHGHSKIIRCFGSAKGLSANDADVVRADIETLVPNCEIQVTLRNDLSCSGLVSEYRRSLAF